MLSKIPAQGSLTTPHRSVRALGGPPEGVRGARHPSLALARLESQEALAARASTQPMLRNLIVRIAQARVVGKVLKGHFPVAVIDAHNYAL
ncbi:MAG: hypothetical protein ACI8QS_001874 [Planctomycetota bacterium]|jgi:hypothetical protein